MATYRQIHVKIWSSPDFQEISSPSKFIFIYLFSNSHRNEAALYRITPKTISNETDIPVDDVIKSLQELDDTGLIKYDKSEYIVWVINAVRYQTVGPNMIKAILKDIEGIEHSFCEDFKGYYKDILNPSGRVPDGIRNPSETLPGNSKGNINSNINSNINNPPISPRGGDVLELPFTEQTDSGQKILNHWNDQKIIVHRELSPKILKEVKKAVKESGEEQVLKAITHFGTMYHDPACEWCKYAWGLDTFLKREKGYKAFLDNGEKWLNYQRQKKSSRQTRAPDRSPQYGEDAEVL